MAYQPTEEEKSLAVAAHLLALVSTFVGPLIFLLARGGKLSPFARFHVKQALAWGAATGGILVLSYPLTFIYVGYLTLVAAVVLNIVFPAVGMIRIGGGLEFLYPKLAETLFQGDIDLLYGEAPDEPIRPAAGPAQADGAAPAARPSLAPPARPHDPAEDKIPLE